MIQLHGGEQFPGLNLEMKLIPVYIAFILALLVIYGYTIIIFTGGIGKNGSTVAVRIMKVCV